MTTQNGVLNHRQKVIGLSGLILIFVLAAFNQTALAPALVLIGSEFGNGALGSWVFSAFLVAATAAIPIYGKLGDLYGRKQVLLVAIIIFIIGSVASTLAQSMPQLVAARILQGLGGGGLMTLAQAAMAGFITPRERGRYMVYFSTAYVVSSVAGPALGGYVAQDLGWRWLFAAMVPLGLLAILVIHLTLPVDSERPAETSIDWLGGGMLFVAVGSLVLALSLVGIDAKSLSLTVTAIAGSMVLGWLVMKRHGPVPSPIVPHSLLRHPSVPASLLLNTITATIHIGSVVIVPMMLQTLHGQSTAQSGLMMIPMLLAPVVSSLLLGQVIARTGYYRLWFVGGFLVMALGEAMLALACFHLSTPLVLAAGIVWGLGFGPCFPVLMITGQSLAHGTQMSAMTGLITLVRSLGSAIGASLFPALLIAFAERSDGDGQLAMTVQANGTAFAGVFIIAAAMAIVAAIVESRQPVITLA